MQKRRAKWRQWLEAFGGMTRRAGKVKYPLPTTVAEIEASYDKGPSRKNPEYESWRISYRRWAADNDGSKARAVSAAIRASKAAEHAAAAAAAAANGGLEPNPHVSFCFVVGAGC